MKKFLKNNSGILIIELLVIAVFAEFYGKFGNVMVDSFREAYIPSRVIAGKLLYRDIFTIYAPFAYLFNALLFLIFGVKLKVLYFAGLFSAMGIFYLTYKISDIFLDRTYTFSVLIFMAAGFTLSSNVFTPFFPYSYGMLYGLVFILGSVYAALNKNFPIAYAAYSFAVCSKYEFILLLPLLIFVSGRRGLIKNLSCILVPAAIVWLPLFISGLTIYDIKTAFDLINIMTSTKTLYWFYSVTGLIFRPELIPIYTTDLIKFIVPIDWSLWQEILIWAFPVILLLFILRFKKLCSNEKVFVAASLLISIKVFFALALQSYGVFFLPFALISLFILIPRRFRMFLTALLLIWSLVIGVKNAEALLIKSNPAQEAIEFVQKNTSLSDRVIVYPECLAVNVLTGRLSDDKFYSLIPLYVETFGEDLIIKRLELIKPEYIIISDYDTYLYYSRKFGEDYAVKILNWIKSNYSLEQTLNSGFAVYKYGV